MNAKTILLVLEVIDIIATGITFGMEAKAEYERIRNRVRQMVEDDQAPDPEEFASLLSRSEAVRDSLRQKAGLEPA